MRRRSRDTRSPDLRPRSGERYTLHRLVGPYYERRLRAIRLRLDLRLHSRADPSDVLQAVLFETWKRREEYIEGPPMPFLVWLRSILGPTLFGVYRQFVRGEALEPRPHAPGRLFALAAVSVASFLQELVGESTSPSRAVFCEEMEQRLGDILDELSPEEEDVLMLRRFEGLINGEAAHELGMTPATTRERYTCALARFTERVAPLPGLPGCSWTNWSA